MRELYRNTLRAVAAFTLALALGSCSEDPTEEYTPATPTITLSNIDTTNGIEFLYSAANTVSFTLTTDASWEITKDEGWFVVSPNSGNAGEEILITATATINSDEKARESSFTITSNSGDNVNKVIAEQRIKVSQDGYGNAAIIVGGDIEDGALVFESDETTPQSFTIMSTYAWEITADTDDWYTITPTEGAANTLTTVTITPNGENTSSDKFDATLTITATDADLPENSATAEVSLVQLFPADSHAVGFEFFDDDFSWVTTNWSAPYTQYGWATFKIDGTNYNEFNAEDITDFATKEYSYTTDASYIYARYEGCVKLGKTNYMGDITLPTLAIDSGKGATLLVEFDAALYSTAKPTIDSGAGSFYVSVDDVSGARVGGWVETSEEISISNTFSWKRYSALIYGATSETKITLGSSDKVTRRIHLDNISVTRADDIAPAQPEVTDVTLPLDYEVLDLSSSSLYNGDGEVSADGADLTYSIRINDAWVATPTVDWINIASTKVGTSTSSIGATVADGILTATATALPYNGTVITVDRSSTSTSREGTIEITARGEVIETITIKQEAGAAIQLRLSGDLVDFGTYTDVIVLEDKDASATYTLNGTAAWSVKSKSDWITLSQTNGTANTDDSLTITTTEENTGFRKYGYITFELSDGTDSSEFTYIVTQNTVSPGNVLCDITSSPAEWELSTDNYTSGLYFYDFVGNANDTTPYFNNIPSKNGAGFISYTHAYSDYYENCARYVGTTGEPYIKGGWKGDSWSIKLYTTGVAAGSKIRFTAVSKASGTGLKYWLGEYKDGGVWKTVATPISVETRTEGSINYTHAHLSTATCPLDYTVTLENTIASGEAIEFRFTCQSLDQANGTGTLAAPNTGTVRFCGENSGTGYSPKIEIVTE
ncbi:MAG: hypothetical protein R3Y68_02700 [Rikenellaceae bacterium]